MGRKITILVLFVLILNTTIKAGIPMTDIAALAQRIANWAKEVQQWESYLKSFGVLGDPAQQGAANFMGAFLTTNEKHHKGFINGLNEIAELRTDLEQLDNYINQVCDLDLNTWRDIFNEGVKIESKYPELNEFDYLQSNPLYANPDIKALSDKYILIRKERVKRINLVSQLLKEINEIEKSIARQVGEFHQKIDSYSKAGAPAGAASLAKSMYSHASIRLQMLRARTFGSTLMRTLIEMRLKKQVEDAEMDALIQKVKAKDAENIEQLKGGK